MKYYYCANCKDGIHLTEFELLRLTKPLEKIVCNCGKCKLRASLPVNSETRPKPRKRG